MEQRLLVLYLDEKTGAQTWCLYSGGKEEADKETALMMKQNEYLEERGRIWIRTTAEMVWFD